MNILPKKRWHVRTKDNIARVRKDEAEAREEERKKQEKLELAESEARVNFLRKRTGVPEKHSTSEDSSQPQQSEVEQNEESSSQHVNLFADYKTHVKTTNKDLEKEKKDEQEKYEKQIGYLTYLGQDTNEALRLKSWYEVAPKRMDVGAERGDLNEKDLKIKHNHDPLTLINALLPPDAKIATKAGLKRKRTPSPLVAVVTSYLEEPKDYKKHKKHKKDRKHKKEKDKKHTKEHKHSKHKKHKSKLKDLEAEEQLQKRLKLEKLRRERLRRESAEKARQDALLAPKETIKPQEATAPSTAPRVVRKYNSQFNPELAKQNMN